MEKEKPFESSPMRRTSPRHFQDEHRISAFFTLEKRQGIPAQFINFCLKDGNELALPAQDIDAIRLDPACEILLFFGATAIHIRGRNLHGLYRPLLRRKVTEIREYPDEKETSFTEQEVFITSILIESYFLDKEALPQTLPSH